MLRKRMFQSLIGRLKTDRGVLTADRVRAFQSLIGRLKTTGGIADRACRTEFQSLIGRLKTQPLQQLSVELARVSIPHR